MVLDSVLYQHCAELGQLNRMHNVQAWWLSSSTWALGDIPDLRASAAHL